MGNYESFRTSATIETSYDFESQLQDAELRAEQLLDEALKNDLLEAAKLSDVRNTYVLTWNEEKYGRDFKS